MANQISVRNNFKSVCESGLFFQQAVKSLCVLLQGGEQLIQSKLFNALKLTRVQNFNRNVLRATLSRLEDEDYSFCLMGCKACATNRSYLYDNINFLGPRVFEATDTVHGIYVYIEISCSFLDIFHSINNCLKQEINPAYSMCN